ncbi:MAG: 2-amino-4-hydroxy-6-hydroxymethyldihydropteridine diphosphokinase [Candidatus Cryptobacteroides sp.]
MVQVYFSLGSNLGNRRENVLRAIGMMEEQFSILDGVPRPPAAVSKLIETEPWGFSAEQNFINCAVRFDLEASCRDILRCCQNIEQRLGRPEHGIRTGSDGLRIYESRLIDIDIILYGSETISEPGLTVPHPLFRQRPFVLEPLREIISPEISIEF